MSGYKTAHEVDQYLSGASAVDFLIKEAFFFGVVGGFYLGSLGGGILLTLGTVLFFGMVSRSPSLSGFLAVVAGIAWGAIALHVASALGAGDFSAWTVGIVIGAVACAIHVQAMQHNRIVTS